MSECYGQNENNRETWLKRKGKAGNGDEVKFNNLIKYREGFFYSDSLHHEDWWRSYDRNVCF